MPALLRPYPIAPANDRGPDEQLISRTPHSLRGLHATLATEAGATSHVVASALGHSSPVVLVTHAHYIEGGTARRARSKRALGQLALDGATSVRIAGNG